VRKLPAVSALALVVAFTALPATALVAPTPERVQAWANKPQRYDVVINDKDRTLRNTPLELLGTLNEQYASTMERLQLKVTFDANPDLAVTATGLSYVEIRAIIGQLDDVADQGSEYVDIYRRILTHSPDKKLNKRMNRALSVVGDVFDSVHEKDYDNALQDNVKSNAYWTEIQQLLGTYGVDPSGGGEWSLATGTSAS
jgi:hypothetical protein